MQSYKQKKKLLETEKICCNILDNIRLHRLQQEKKEQEHKFFYNVLKVFKTQLKNNNDGGIKIPKLLKEQDIKEYKQYYNNHISVVDGWWKGLDIDHHKIVLDNDWLDGFDEK